MLNSKQTIAQQVLKRKAASETADPQNVSNEELKLAEENLMPLNQEEQ